MISTYNQAAIQALESSKGALGQHLVNWLHEKIEEIHDKHRDEALEIWWTPGHEEIRENQRADEETKKQPEETQAQLPSCPMDAEER